MHQEPLNNCLILNRSLLEDEDVRFIVDIHNCFHGGQEQTVAQKYRLVENAEAAWLAFRKNNEISTHSCPASGPFRYEGRYQSFVLKETEYNTRSGRNWSFAQTDLASSQPVQRSPNVSSRVVLCALFIQEFSLVWQRWEHFGNTKSVSNYLKSERLLDRWCTLVENYADFANPRLNNVASINHAHHLKIQMSSKQFVYVLGSRLVAAMFFEALKFTVPFSADSPGDIRLFRCSVVVRLSCSPPCDCDLLL